MVSFGVLAVDSLGSQFPVNVAQTDFSIGRHPVSRFRYEGWMGTVLILNCLDVVNSHVWHSLCRRFRRL